MQILPENKKTIPIQIFNLFWEYAPESIDIDAHRDLIIARITERGSWDSMKWLLQTYSKEQILSFLNKKGIQTLPLRELNYWLLMMGISSEERDQIINKTSESNHVWNNRYSY
ncbi:MAG: hypothetical protein JW927_11145 [Deltaproteobacteria bacterium]|nr:hypothetical protein [Deltaproteobacteria bacterium]